MTIQGLPITLVQVVQSLHIRCDQCERRIPFVVYAHHLSEVHASSGDGQAVQAIMAWVDDQDQPESVRTFIALLYASYVRWKMENPE